MAEGNLEDQALKEMKERIRHLAEKVLIANIRIVGLRVSPEDAARLSKEALVTAKTFDRVFEEQWDLVV